MIAARQQPEAQLITEVVESALTRFIASQPKREQELKGAEAQLPAEVLGWLGTLTSKADSYRDALLVLLAVPIVRGGRSELRRREEGWRTATRKVGKLLKHKHIKGVNEAFENIAKNTPVLVRGNRTDFDSLLIWASDEADVDDLAAAFNYIAAKIAATARTVEPRPKLRPAALTFPRVMALLDEMLRVPSGGAHEQYVIASLFEAAFEQAGSGQRVETKGMSASDRSSRTAGDIEVFLKGQRLEGVEVSANPWDAKLDQAEEALRQYGLPRAHIIARADLPDVYAKLVKMTESDISVLDVRAATTVSLALLDRGKREFALLRLYDLLDQKLASADLVNAYVRRLRDHGLAGA